VSDKSKIEWTDATWNPITGCTKVSEGCKNCYAERIARRFWERPFSEVVYNEEKLRIPTSWKKPRKIFVCSMSDLFHENISFKIIADIWDEMRCNLHHTFMILTKRPERAREFWEYYYGNLFHESIEKHIWLGVTAETQQRADERIQILLKIPAAVRFVSIEPMLEQIDISYYLNGCPEKVSEDEWAQTEYPLDWVICGCESGQGARPFDWHWAQDLKNQCINSGVAFFYKQGRYSNGLIKTPPLDGRKWTDYPDGIPVEV
jgi:protein gp37